MRFFKKLHLVGLVLFIVSSCGQNEDRTRNNETDISGNIVAFDTNDTPISAAAKIYTSDSVVIIKDGASKDKLLTIIEVPLLKIKGQIAKAGPGPDEIAVSGAVNIGEGGKSVTIFDYGQLKIATYDIDSALVDDNYSPVTVGNVANSQFPDRYVHVNDTLGFARSITMNPKKRSYTQGLCRYNITTGELTEITDSTRMEGLKSLFGISVADRLVVEGATNNDILNIYNFKGELLREIRGSEYEPQVSKDKVFFREIEVIPDYILASYSGREGENAYTADRIHVFRHDGSYVKTLVIGKNITDMAYNRMLNRLFCIFDDADIQFGYIELDEVL